MAEEGACDASSGLGGGVEPTKPANLLHILRERGRRLWRESPGSPLAMDGGGRSSKSGRLYGCKPGDHKGNWAGLTSLFPSRGSIQSTVAGFSKAEVAPSGHSILGTSRPGGVPTGAVGLQAPPIAAGVTRGWGGVGGARRQPGRSPPIELSSAHTDGCAVLQSCDTPVHGLRAPDPACRAVFLRAPPRPACAAWHHCRLPRMRDGRPWHINRRGSLTVGLYQALTVPIKNTQPTDTAFRLHSSLFPPPPALPTSTLPPIHTIPIAKRRHGSRCYLPRPPLENPV